jgi:hypothetical protein
VTALESAERRNCSGGERCVDFIDNIAELFVEPAAWPPEQDGNFGGYSSRILTIE